jgi:hypothetical protein
MGKDAGKKKGPPPASLSVSQSGRRAYFGASTIII